MEAKMSAPRTADSIERPDWACVLCPTPSEDRPWKQADENYLTCEGCVKKIRKQLTDISDRYYRLDPTPGAQGEIGSRGAPGFGSKPTASPHIICLTDRRSSPTSKAWIAADGRVHCEPERPPLSVFNELETLAWDVCEQRGFDGGPDQRDVYGLTWWLSNQLDWLSRQDSVVEFARTVRGINTKLMPVTGDPRIFVAKCPTVLYDGDDVSTCDSNLYYPTSGDTIMCGNPACKRKWARHEWNGDAPGSLSNLIKDRREKERQAQEQAEQVDQVA